MKTILRVITKASNFIILRYEKLPSLWRRLRRNELVTSNYESCDNLVSEASSSSLEIEGAGVVGGQLGNTELDHEGKPESLAGAVEAWQSTSDPHRQAMNEMRRLKASHEEDPTNVGVLIRYAKACLVADASCKSLVQG